MAKLDLWDVPGLDVPRGPLDLAGLAWIAGIVVAVIAVVALVD